MDGEFAVNELVVTGLLLTSKFLQPPPSSTRPQVLGYLVAHNANGIVEVSETNVTNFVMESPSPNLFIFTVAAINILGAGVESDITSELYTYYRTTLISTLKVG